MLNVWQEKQTISDIHKSKDKLVKFSLNFVQVIIQIINSQINT